MSWTIESDIKLINLVKKYDMFYNPKSADYRNNSLKYDVWNTIGSILNKTSTDCSKRWGYVKSHYVRRRGKPVSVVKCSDVVKNGIKRNKLLKFLDDYRGDSYNNDSSTDQSINEPPSSEISYDNQYTYNENYYVEDEVTYDQDVVQIEDDDNIANLDNETASSLSIVPETLQESKKNTNSEGFNNFDETDHFFASMAKIAKRLPRRDQIMLRMQIATMVGNAELKQMDNRELH